MRRELGEVIDGARADGDRDGVVARQRRFECEHKPVLGVELRVGKDKWFPADAAGATKGAEDRLPSYGERGWVSDDQRRFVREELPEYGGRLDERAGAEFKVTGFPGGLQGTGDC